MLPSLVAIMDAAWITPYALLAGTIWLPPGTSLLHPVVILGLLAGSQLLTRRFLARTGERRAGAVLAALGVLVAAGVVAWQYGDVRGGVPGPLWRTAASALTGSRPAAPAWLLAVLVWRRGLVVGRTTLDYYDVDAVFNLGLAALGIFAVLMACGSSVAALAAVATAAFPYLLVFFAAGLLALPLARLESVQRLTRASARHTRVSGGWYGVLAGAVIVLLGIATLAGVALRLDVKALWDAMGSAANVLLLVILYVIAIPLGVIVAGVLSISNGSSIPGSIRRCHPCWLRPGSSRRRLIRRSDSRRRPPRHSGGAWRYCCSSSDHCGSPGRYFGLGRRGGVVPPTRAASLSGRGPTCARHGARGFDGAGEGGVSAPWRTTAPDRPVRSADATRNS